MHLEGARMWLLKGHAFAGGFTLALAHDFRIMKNQEGKKQIWLSMNEIFFGANVRELSLLARYLAET